MAFESNPHNVSGSSLAEVAQASIKAGDEKDVSLVDAAYCDIAESTEAEWQNRMNGKQTVGRGHHHSFLAKETNSNRSPEQTSF